MTAQPDAAPRLVESGSRTVTAAEITAYRDAVRDGLPRPAAGHASPVFPFVLAQRQADAVVERLRETQTEPTAVVHVSQEIQISQPLQPGQRLSVHSELLACRQESRGARLALRSILTQSDDDRPVADLRSAVLLSGATSAATFGAQQPSTTPPLTANGDGIQVTRQLTTEFIARYADASDDHNPIHLDPAAAAAAGFPGVIAHGMSVVALVCEEIADRCLDGDIGRIHALGVRFSAPVRPDESLDIRLQPAAGAVGFSARTPHGPALKSGWVGFDE